MFKISSRHPKPRLPGHPQAVDEGQERSMSSVRAAQAMHGPPGATATCRSLRSLRWPDKEQDGDEKSACLGESRLASEESQTA